MLKVLSLFSQIIKTFNIFMGYTAGIVIAIVSGILLFEVLVRYFFGWPTEWEIELSVMLLIITTFLAAGFTQLSRSHVNIEIIDFITPKKFIKWRVLLSDIISLLFCSFFSWSSWLLFHEAWTMDRRSESVWSPKLWPVFFFMAFGMSTLTLQILIQIIEESLSQIFKATKDNDELK